MSLRIIDLATQRGKVTLNTAYRGIGNQIKQGESLFKEITSEPPQLTGILRKIAIEGPQVKRNNIPDIAEAIERSIEQAWKPGMFHLVPHSSGIDSRIISQTLVNLNKKHGDEWIGDLLFFCRLPEVEEFKLIMSFQGWKPDQFVYQEKDKLEEAVHFRKIWMDTNDYCFPVFTEPYTQFISRLMEAGRITKHLSQVQYIGGALGNESFMYTPQRIVDRFYYGKSFTTIAHATYGEIFSPFQSYDVLSRIKPSSDRGYLYKIARMPLALAHKTNSRAARIVPSLLGPLGVRTTTQEANDNRMAILEYLSYPLSKMSAGPAEGPHDESRVLSDELREKCRISFIESWYYDNVIKGGLVHCDWDVPRILWYDDFWNEYARAAICEELINRGVEIVTQGERV